MKTSGIPSMMKVKKTISANYTWIISLCDVDHRGYNLPAPRLSQHHPILASGRNNIECTAAAGR